MPDPIIFYDIDSPKAGRAWSPHTWRTRYALNYKGIPYKTEWVEYPDIEALCKKIGASATTKKDGRDHYTLPVIYDPSTGKVVSDSLAISKYLDTAYPSTPQLFPPGTHAFQAAFNAGSRPAILLPTLHILLSRIADGLNPPSSVYFRRTREAQFGKLEEANTAKAWEDSDLILGSTLSWAKVIAGEESEDWKRIAGFGDGFCAKILAQFEEYGSIDA